MRFLSTVACEKVIVDKGGAHTLIEIMSGADIAATPPANNPAAELPSNALAPKQWWIFSMWEPNDDDVGKDFEQVYTVYWPNGDKLVDGARASFKMTDRVQYMSFYVFGLPVGQQGKVKISTWVEKAGNRITDPFDYFITIRHIPQNQYPPDIPHSISQIASH
jgi:hypothetical protein